METDFGRDAREDHIPFADLIASRAISCNRYDTSIRYRTLHVLPDIPVRDEPRYPDIFSGPEKSGPRLTGEIPIQIITETHETQVQARQALTRLYGRKVGLAHHSVGSLISLEFTPLYSTRRTMTASGRLIGGRKAGHDSIFFYCLDWTLRFGSLSMTAMQEGRDWRLRKWLERLEGRILLDARFDAVGTLDLVFDSAARLTAFHPSDDPNDDTYWDVCRRPHPVAWSDHIGPRSQTRYRGAD